MGRMYLYVVSLQVHYDIMQAGLRKFHSRREFFSRDKISVSANATPTSADSPRNRDAGREKMQQCIENTFDHLKTVLWMERTSKLTEQKRFGRDQSANPTSSRNLPRIDRKRATGSRSGEFVFDGK